MYFGRDMPQHILSIYWRQKAARQQRPAITFVDKKGVNYTLCVLTSWNLDNFIISSKAELSSQRPIYGMNTTHALIVSWRQALCPVVRMLDRVYYIIKVGLCTARFMDMAMREPRWVERAQWCKLHSFCIHVSFVCCCADFFYSLWNNFWSSGALATYYHVCCYGQGCLETKDIDNWRTY